MKVASSRPARLLDKAITLPVLIFVLVFAVHVASPVITSYDSAWSIHTTVSLLREGNIDLDEYKSLIEGNPAYTTQTINGHIYNYFPIGVSIIAIPFVLGAKLVLQAIPDEAELGIMQTLFPGFRQYYPPYPGTAAEVTRTYTPNSVVAIYPVVELVISCTIVALTAVMLYLLARLFLSKTYSVWAALIFAFCTSAWSTVSRGLWQHGPSMLLLTIALYLLIRAKDKASLVQYVSLPLALAYLIRPTNSISVLLLTVYVLLRYRKYFGKYLLWSLLVAGPFLLSNVVIYGSVIPPYFRQGIGSAYIFEAMAGTLISPNRGLFIFTPVLLLSIIGIGIKIRARQFDFLDLNLLAILIFHWVLISAYFLWWGGYSYGPRLFSDMLPYLIYFMLPSLDYLATRQNKRRTALAVLSIGLVAISAFIHAHGATSYDTILGWSSYNRAGVEASVDYQPERLWDWQDLQILRSTPLIPQIPNIYDPLAPPKTVPASVTVASGLGVVMGKGWYEADPDLKLRWMKTPGLLEVFAAQPTAANLVLTPAIVSARAGPNDKAILHIKVNGLPLKAVGVMPEQTVTLPIELNNGYNAVELEVEGGNFELPGDQARPVSLAFRSIKLARR